MAEPEVATKRDVETLEARVRTLEAVAIDLLHRLSQTDPDVFDALSHKRGGRLGVGATPLPLDPTSHRQRSRLYVAARLTHRDAS